MISKETLEKVLREANFEEERINRILNKSIKLLLDRGIESNIKEVLEVLEEFDISKDAIESCLNILAKGKKDNIKEVLKVLKKFN